MSKSLPSFTKPDESRSANMRSIRSAGNRTTELRLRSLFIRSGIQGWKVTPQGILGKPDFLFPKHNVAIFIDGCFWHACPKCGHTPKTNRKYWSAKIERNKQRDKRISNQLRRSGFTVVRIWECALKRDPNGCLTRVMARVLLSRA